MTFNPEKTTTSCLNQYLFIIHDMNQQFPERNG